MRTLEQAVQLVRDGLIKSKNVPALIATQLEQLAGDCEAAAKVWQDYLAHPGAAGDQWSIVSWVGPVRAKQLHEIHLAALARVRAISDAAAGQLSRYADFDQELIELAYRQLKTGESGVDAANAAIAKLRERVTRIQALRAEVIKGPGKAAKSVTPRPTAVRRAGAKRSKTVPAKKTKMKPKKKAPAKK